MLTMHHVWIFIEDELHLLDKCLKLVPELDILQISISCIDSEERVGDVSHKLHTRWRLVKGEAAEVRADTIEAEVDDDEPLVALLNVLPLNVEAVSSSVSLAGRNAGLIMPIGSVVRPVGLLPAAWAIIKSTTSSALAGAGAGNPKVGSGPSMVGGVSVANVGV